MAILVVVANAVSPVKITEQHTLRANAVITPGQMVYEDPTTGRLLLASAGGAGTAVRRGIALTGAENVNEPVTFMQKGVINLGLATLDGLAIGASVFIGNTAGSLDSAPGTVSTIAGTVFAVDVGTSVPDRVLRVDL